MAPRKKVEAEAETTEPTTTRSRKAPAKEVAEKKVPAKKVEEDTRHRFNPADLMMTELDAIEKKTGYTNDGIGRYSPRLSTGVLAIDMYMDGGLVAGGWYTVAGGEQSCKSTLTMTLLASVVKQNFKGIGAIFDFEGSTDENYILSIFKNFKIEIDPATIFGVQDPTTGEWLVRGRFRYYPPSNGERFFDYMAQLRKMLPDKLVDSNGDGYLVYENTNPNRKLVGEYYDKGYFRRNNKFKVLAEDAGAQAIVVVDSYPAMLPDSMDGDDKAGALAIQARMFSDGIKRFRGAMRKKMITILGVNQLRKNPMNQYEPEYEPCFIGSTPIQLSDGTVHTIQYIVENKLDVHVRSFNTHTGEVENKRIIDWKSNGFKEAKDLVTIHYATGFGDHGHFTSTRDHKIWCSGGWVKAGDLEIESNIYTERHAVLSSVYVTKIEEVLHGEHVYDLTVEDNHTYFAGSSAYGVAVSNCGDALKFYCFAPETELYINGEFIRAIDVYEEGKQIEVFTRQGKQTATIFKTDGGEYKESITLNYSGIDLTCSIGHAVLTVVHDSVQSPRDDQTLVDIGRVSWKRAKDAPLFSYGFVLNHEHYTDRLAIPSSDRDYIRNICWERFIYTMFPILKPVLEYMSHNNLLIRDAKNFMYNSAMIQEVINTHYFSDPSAEILAGQDYEDVSMALAFLDDAFAMLDESQDFIPIRLTEKDVVEERPQFYLDVNEPVTGTVVTNGLLSHNSDVRFRLQSRAIPAPFKGERKVVEEDSVEYEGRVDRYRFISGRSIKNKLGGIPNQEFWMRLWEADGQGKGRGFDPVYDVFFYLKEIKILTGIHNKFKFTDPCPLSKAKRAINWNELRVLVLGDRKQISDLCAKLEIKAFALRKWCFDFVKTDKSKALVTASVVAKGGSIKDDEEGM